MVERPAAGLHYPAATGEFMAWFSTDADCLDYLERLRWPSGFVCPECGQGGWRLGDGRFECSGCGLRTSVTAGTIFDRIRTLLTVWFIACWQFAAAKDGISALSLQRSLEIGSYQTAWAMLHRLRSVLVRPGRERLTGMVEVDETYIGGEEPGLRGGRAKGKKLLVGIAVERHQPRGLGRCRMVVLPNAKTDTLRAFLADHVEEGATVITDGWQPYRAATEGRYVHVRQPGAGREANTTLPGVHRVASLAKRWLLGTHQGSADDAHLPSYLDEFVFRFNRRRSRSRGLVFYRVLEPAVAHEPVRYRDLVLNPRTPTGPRQPPGTRGKPPTLDRPPARRPWRAADQPSSGYVDTPGWRKGRGHRRQRWPRPFLVAVPSVLQPSAGVRLPPSARPPAPSPRGRRKASRHRDSLDLGAGAGVGADSGYHRLSLCAPLRTHRGEWPPASSASSEGWIVRASRCGITDDQRPRRARRQLTRGRPRRFDPSRDRAVPLPDGASLTG